MSDSGDTDDLLLIPPDQYAAESEIVDEFSNGPYYDIVDSLICQVDKLQSRVNSIEALNTSQSSTMHNSHRYNSSDDILRDGYLNSTFSTPQKPRIRYRAPQVASNAEQFTATPKRRLQLEDEGRITVPCALNGDLVEVNGKVINLAEIEQMLEEIELHKRKNELRLREKEQEMNKQQIWKLGENEQTLPPSRQCEENASESSKSSSMTSARSKKSSLECEKACTCSSSSTSSSSRVTVTRFNPIESQSDTSLTTNKTQRAVDENDHISLNGLTNNAPLMSLRYLWSKDRTLEAEFQDKLEEEKLRRQHCEEIIQELQTKLLEKDERIAVAVQVDKAKDKALLMFQTSWEKVCEKLKSLTNENQKLGDHLLEMQQRNETCKEEWASKLKHEENEAVKALNLAHANMEQLDVYKNQFEEVQEKLMNVQRKLEEVAIAYENEMKRNTQLNNIVVQKELELSENKSVLNDSRNEVANSKRAIEQCQEELANIKDQNNDLQSLLNSKQIAVIDLEKKKQHLIADNDNYKLLLCNSEKKIQLLNVNLEKSKSELKEFYQRQVELLVQEKLKEFQVQLDNAEKSLQDETKKRELCIAKTAATHIQQITDKHNLEVNLLEQKQKEEIKLYKMKLQQAHAHIDGLQLKIKQYHERRSNLAQQLHKVMEVQWIEALKIINNSKSPHTSTPNDNTLDQLKTLKSKSQSNLEEVLSERGSGDDGDKKDFNACHMNGQLNDTPVSSKMHKTATTASNDVNKYVQMLLQKAERATQGVQVDSPQDIVQSHSTKEVNVNGDERHKMLHERSKIPGKPPWK